MVSKSRERDREAVRRRVRQKGQSGHTAPSGPTASEERPDKQVEVAVADTQQALRQSESEGAFAAGFREGHREPWLESVGLRRDDVAGSSVLLAEPHHVSFYGKTVTDGFLKGAADLGLRVQFHYLDFNPEIELSFVSRVADSGLDGLAFYPLYRTPEECELVADLCQRSFPCVLFDRRLPEADTDFVGTDNQDAYERLTDILITHGHKTIAYVARDFADSVMDDRLAGYRRALENAGLPYREKLLIEGEWHFAAPAIVKDFVAHKPRPTAFLCSDQYSADILLSALQTCQLGVSEDVEIASMDDREPDEYHEAPWLTAVQDGYAIGRQTAEFLAARIAQPNRASEQRLVKATILSHDHRIRAPTRANAKGRKELQE
ncbi:MAG TPA: substrate-binding domain-containing protein [Candidatus Hydrogenedentes bacterium]|nr:substrate-binding domain-containing protein [Candidatus Hydrogenedentota bacterium]